jgi:hypothetical protein
MMLSPRITARTMALPAAASAQALVSSYLHRYEVIVDPLTSMPSPARRGP